MSRPRSRPTPASGRRSRLKPFPTSKPTSASPSPGSRRARTSRTRTPSAASSTRWKPDAWWTSRAERPWSPAPAPSLPARAPWYRDPVTAVVETNEPDGDAAVRPAQPRHLIVTVYGLYARPDGGWLSVAALIRLLADLGVDEPAVRSAISRLKRRGILQADKEHME